MSDEKRKLEWSLDLGDLRARATQFVSDMAGGKAETKQASLREERGDATSAQLIGEFAVGRTTLGPLPADSDALFTAELRYVGEYEYEVAGAAERVIKLRQRSGAPRDWAALAGSAQDLHWELALARGMPLRLRLQGGLGEADLDLRDLQVETLRLRTGVGKVRLKLGGEFDAELAGGLGKTEIQLVGGGGRLGIKGGVGEVNLRAAAGMAIRLEARQGLGQIKLPRELQERAAGAVWETDGYAEAGEPVLIAYQGGVGSFSLEWDADEA